MSPEKLNGSNGDAATTTNGTPPRNGNDYLRIMNKERERLIATADDLDKEIEELLKDGITEDIVGYLRSATGKARLLATQKMVQFEGLCNKHLKPPADDPCPTKLHDLQGFWDMVMIQVFCASMS